MSPPRKSHEPTMEDILSSIRKMVTDDMDTRPNSSGIEDTPAETRKPAKQGRDMEQAGGKTGILELTHMVNDDGTVTDLRHAKKAVSAEDAKPEDTKKDTAEMKPESGEFNEEREKPETEKKEGEGSAISPEPQAGSTAPSPETPGQETSDLPPSEPGWSGQTRPSQTEPTEAQSGQAPSDQKRGGTASAWVGHNQTLEALVLEAIEPKIRAWLDENMERMVREVLQQKVDVPADQLEKSAREMVRRELKAMLNRLDQD